MPALLQRTNEPPVNRSCDLYHSFLDGHFPEYIPELHNVILLQIKIKSKAKNNLILILCSSSIFFSENNVGGQLFTLNFLHHAYKNHVAK